MKRSLKWMAVGLLTAVGLSLPGTGWVSRAEAQARTRTAARSRALPRLTVRSMVTGMAEMDPQAVKLSLNRYRVVQANDLMEKPQLRRLVELVDDNSTARRNQNLMTAMLRQSQRLSTSQTVVGADLRRRQLFVADNRIISPTNGIR